jgi:HPt (histidine-containing phosphotransfer) domain-containing protein
MMQKPRVIQPNVLELIRLKAPRFQQPCDDSSEVVAMLEEFPRQESPALDVQELINRCMGNIELAERVLAKLQSRYEEDVLELERALSNKNGKLLASVAHRLKGAASNVAAHDLRESAARIEDSARKELFDAIPAQLDVLRTQWTRLNEATLSGTTAPICS